MLINVGKNRPSIAGSAGFTLVELVAVIVILGILALTALPKFVNVNTDGRIASLETLKGALKSSIRNLKAVCNLYEECRSLPSWPNLNVYIPAYGQNIHMIGGFPEAGTLSREGEIHDLIDPTGFDVTTPDGSRTRWSIPDTENCYVQYKQIGSGETFPVIDLVSHGC